MSDGGHPPPDAGTDDPPSGGRYDPAIDSWAPVSLEGAPDKRWFHTAVWTGDGMLVWGGGSNVYGPEKATDGLYDPVADRGEATPLNAAPGPRMWHVAAWTGDEMLVWGGRGNESLYFRTGGRYAFLPDNDEDGFCGSRDCDDADATVYEGAPEINDARDNQCPGDTGFATIDELAAESRFEDDRLAWSPQPGATSYEVARASSVDFVSECMGWTTKNTFVDDTATPAAGVLWHYLARALAPNPGSLGTAQQRSRAHRCLHEQLNHCHAAGSPAPRLIPSYVASNETSL